MISLENIYKYYYSESSVTQALRNVNLEFSKGEFVAITGESGSGKTTLLNVISGIDTYDEGEMYVNGQPTFQYDDDDWEEYRRDKIGFVFQNYNLVSILNVYENIVLPIELDGTKIDTVYVDKIMDVLGLSEKKFSMPNQLSGGQQQRVAIARALAAKPSIILADEPTGNLDSKTSMDVIALLKLTGKEFAQTIVMITHNEEIATMADQMIRIEDGRIFSAGVPDGANGGEKDA